MYTLLLTFVAVTLAYPYANYGQPAYYRTGYHKNIPYRGPVLRQFYPGMMGMGMGGMGGAGAGGATGAQGGSPMGGMGSYIMSILNMFAPGIAQNPMMAGAMYGIDGGDWNDLFEGAMKGDFEKITNKIYDGGFDGDFMPFMMGGMGGMFGGAGRQQGTAGGASGAQAGAGGMGGFGGMGFNPMMMGFYDMLNQPAVQPVNTRLMAIRQATEAAAEASAPAASAPAAHAGPFGGMGMMAPGAFMGAMNDVFRNPAAMNAMRFTLDSSDMSDIMEAYGKGDVYEIMSKTMGKGFNPYMFQRKPAAAGTTGTGTGTTTGTGSTAPVNPFGGFFPNFGGMMNPWMMSEMFDFESPF